MKNIKYLIDNKIFLLLIFAFFYQKIDAQICMDWKNQTTGYVIVGYTSNNQYDYIWHEETNIKQGVHICVLPSENVPIYIQQNNNYINFTTRISPTLAYSFMVNIDVNINDNGYFNIYSGSSKQDVVWYNSSNYFSSIGQYNLKVKIQESLGQEFFREYDIFVIPTSQKLFKDNFGNTLRLWEGNNAINNIPIVFSEGFDAYNTNPQEMYYSVAEDLMSCLRQNGFDIFLLDNKYGTQDIRNNATGFSTAINYISNLNNNQLVIAGGVSMGGIIARYALAKAENDGSPLPASIFISIDSPQQGAIISNTLQDYKREKQEGDEFAEHALNNDAAKQLLIYNTYDQSGSIHQSFFSEMDNLNGNGYPHLTKNIGVSFSNNQPNPNSGTWIEIEWHVGPFQGEVASFDLTDDEKIAGSFLPIDLTSMDPTIMRASYWWVQLLFPPIQVLYYPTISFNRSKDPTYISYISALDIVNDQSKFDNVIIPENTSHHDILPHDIINPIVNELIFSDLYIQNQIINYDFDFIGQKIKAGNNVTNIIPNGDVIITNGTNITFTGTEEVLLKNGFLAEAGTDLLIHINNNLYISCDKSNSNYTPIINFTKNNNNYIQTHTPNSPISNIVYEKNNIISNHKIISKPIIFPNPSKDILNIIITGLREKIIIKISDILGNTVYKNETLFDNSTSIDISCIPDGIYLVRILFANEIITKKVIIQ